MPTLIRGEGPSPCQWLVLGEAPGASEEELGRPFVGRSGRTLDAALDAAGMARADVFVTNAYKLRPPGNRNPSRYELAEQAHLLRIEFDAVQPARVLTLGNIPLHVLVPDAPGVTKARGQVYESNEFNVDVWPAFHPAYVLRNPSEKETFFTDVRNYFA